MATQAYAKELLTLTFPSAADYKTASKKYYAVGQSSAGAATLATVAGQRVAGILQNEPGAAGDAASVMVLGVSMAILGNTVAYDDPLTVDSSGRLVTSTAATDYIVGRALSSGAVNTIIPVQLSQSGTSRGGARSVHRFPVLLTEIADGDILTEWTPGYAGTIEKVWFETNKAVTTAAKASTINLEIGTTNLTGGVISLTSAACTPMGKIIAGTAITAGNSFGASDTISIEASSTTQFSEGSGRICVQILETL